MLSLFLSPRCTAFISEFITIRRQAFGSVNLYQDFDPCTFVEYCILRILVIVIDISTKIIIVVIFASSTLAGRKDQFALLYCQ